MDPKDFLQLARRLARETDEASLRSATSRAYYAAFNVARDLLRNLDFDNIANRRTHGEIHRPFQNCGVPGVTDAGRMLSELHSERVDADYKLGLRKWANPNNAALHNVRAGLIINQLDKCLASKELSLQVTQGIQEYERRLRPPSQSGSPPAGG